jgi:hypothetical protein
MGFTTLHEIKEYELEKKNQEKELKSKKVRESAPYLYESRGGGGGGMTTNNSSDDFQDDDRRGSKRRGRPSRTDNEDGNKH